MQNFLGLLVDSKLNWKNNINNLSTAVSAARIVSKHADLNKTKLQIHGVEEDYSKY